jgi:DNA adenine methylase
MSVPPFAYFGGKIRAAEKIVPLLPPHGHYVEPFAGSLAVLLAKPQSRMETVNDLDGNLMLFWRMLRDRPEDLALAMALTPHSRAEHQDAYRLDEIDGDDLERARKVWVMLSQGRGGTMRRTGWRFYRNPGASTYAMPDYLEAYARRVPSCADRIARVSLECRDALDVIADYGQHPDVLLYVDPPYLGTTRAANYAHEMLTEDAHRALAEALRAARAAVVLSGYASPLYEDLYPDWHRAEFAAWTGNGIRDGRTRVDGERTEVLWANRPWPAADDLFSDGAA